MPKRPPVEEDNLTPSFWISRKRKRGKEPRRGTFPLLFDGEENEEARELRKETFEKLWQQQESEIDEILGTFNEKIADELSEFVKGVELDDPDRDIPAGIILAGSNLAGHTRLFSQVKDHLNHVVDGPVVVLSSNEVTNLQSLQKKVISGCLQVELNDEEEGEQTAKNIRFPGRLPYDMGLLEEWYTSQPNTSNLRIIIAFQDTEAFSISLISEFILRNQSRFLRLPIVFLFGIASTLEQFQQVLPPSVVQALDTQIFQVRQNDECLRLIIDNILMGDEIRLRLGPRVLSFLIERYKSWNLSIEEFISGIKYAYMCHFYANPLSVILSLSFTDPEQFFEILTPIHLNAIRALPSMRAYVEEKLDEKDIEEVKSLLYDDAYLASLIPQLVDLVQTRAREIRQSVILLAKLSERTKTRRDLGELYLGALAGEVNSQTPFVRELLQKFSSSGLIEFLSGAVDALPETSEVSDTFEQYLEEIEMLTAQVKDAETNENILRDRKLTSEFEIEARPGMRSTKVSQKLRQEKDRKNMTSEDTEYTKLVESLNDYLKEIFANLAPTTDAPLYEVFYFNVAKTHADVFTAQPRESYKTAFRNPAHWLHCQCCTKTSDHDAIRSTQPNTSILHELYLESTTSLINLYDWFSVFKEVKGEDEGVSEEQLYAQFMASLDELMLMGYVKRTLRKRDHVEKLVGG